VKDTFFLSLQYADKDFGGIILVNELHLRAEAIHRRDERETQQKA